MGHIKVDRKILEWEWYLKPNTCHLFIHMLLKANWKDGKFQGIEIPRGSFATSYQRLANETGLSVRNVRTALDQLKSTGEVTVRRHSKFSVITIKNYCLYQSTDTVPDNHATSNRQTSDSQVTTIEEKKEVKKGRSNNIYTPPFERIWKAYPRKKEKTEAYKAYKARLSDGFSEDELEQAVKNYAAECKKNKTEDKYIKHGATFFGPSTPFLDYLKRKEQEATEDYESSVSVRLW